MEENQSVQEVGLRGGLAILGGNFTISKGLDLGLEITGRLCGTSLGLFLKEKSGWRGLEGHILQVGGPRGFLP